jgi:hypothetical protein
VKRVVTRVFLFVILDNLLMASSRRLSTPSDYAELLSRYDTWLFDCDGVIWSGDHALEGASKAIDFLRDHGKRVIFVTNNAARSRKMLKKKFDRLRIAASEVRITSLWMGHLLTSACLLSRMRLYPAPLPQPLISRKCSSSPLIARYL